MKLNRIIAISHRILVIFFLMYKDPNARKAKVSINIKENNLKIFNFFS